MPIRTDLNVAIRPTPTSSSSPTPATPETPSLTVDQLMGKALDGTITPGEATQLSKMLDSPALKDAFTPQQRKDLQKFAEGKGLPPREPKELHGDLKLVKNAKGLPERFAADLVLAHDQLLEHAALLRADKATRLFQFAVPYAQAIAETAQNAQERKAATALMLAEAEKAGFKQLERQPDGENGLKALKELMRAGAEDIGRLASHLKFDAPSWPKDPVKHDPHAAEQLAVQKTAEPQVMKAPSPVLQPPIPIQQQKVTEAEDAQQPGHDGTDKKLGGPLLWNVLHRFRSNGENDQESAAQRDRMNQLAIAMALILGFMAIVVGILVAL